MFGVALAVALWLSLLAFALWFVVVRADEWLPLLIFTVGVTMCATGVARLFADTLR